MAVKKGPVDNKGPESSMASAMRNAGITPTADETQAQSAPQQQKPAPAPQAAQPQPAPQQGYKMNTNQPNARVGSRGKSLLDVNANHRRPVSRTMSGEGVQHLLSGLNARALASMTEAQRNDFRFLVLDNNQVKVTYSSVLVCYKEIADNVTNIAVYSLLVESSGADLQPNMTTIDNRTIETIMTPGDVYLHKSYWEVVEKFVIDTYGVNANILDGGCIVIAREFEKEMDEQRFNAILHNATQAVFTVMDNKLGGTDEPFTLAEVGDSDQLTARVEFNNVHDQNIIGMPVRSDIVLTLQAQTQTDPQFGLQQSRSLTRVTGYVDLMYQPQPQQQQPQYSQWGQPQQPTVSQLYQPRLVLTSIDTETDAVTMELQLLALATSMLLARSATWRGTFRSRMSIGAGGRKKDIDLKDVGAIGYEVNLTGDPHARADKLDTKADAFGDQQFEQFMATLFSPQLVYSLDIEEAGELSWVHQTFIAAANGDEPSRQAILQAANNLTLGHFQQCFEFTNPVCYDDQDRIHLGYYTDADGNLRDIRELDYLAILNLAGKDEPDLVQKWEATHRNLAIPLEVRLHDRKVIMDRLTSGTIHVKGFARRVSFDHNFFSALSTSIEKAGLIIRPGNLLEAYTGGNVRGGYDLTNQLVGQDVGKFFSYGNQQQAGSRMFSSPFMGRHGR